MNPALAAVAPALMFNAFTFVIVVALFWHVMRSAGK